MQIEDLTPAIEEKIIQYFSTPKRQCSPEDAREFWTEIDSFEAKFEYGFIDPFSRLKNN